MKCLDWKLLGLVGMALARMNPAHAEIAIGVPMPLTGGMAWIGEQGERGVELAVANLNAAGGVLGQPVRTVVVDDFCEGEQAVAAAKKLVAEGVAMVAGHLCSGASIPARKSMRRQAL
jgi:branched-chain amino acid transport system substrate-binding protein